MNELVRSFTDAKTVESPALNRAGIQPLRALLARGLYGLRQGSDDPKVDELVRTGLLVWEDFLPPDVFDAVDREADEFMASTEPRWLHQHGTTEVRHYLLSAAAVEGFPYLGQWRGHDEVMALASAAERRTLRRSDGGPLFEHLTVGDHSVPDTQTELHVDTFFNTHKVWLYLDDVTVENAAFVYVPGSHRFDRHRLREEYVASTTPSEEKSRRVGDQEVRRRGLERRVVTCPRNTLIVANTCGYHCRSVGEAGATRRSLHMAFRFNPFARGTRRPSDQKRSEAQNAG